MKKVSASLVLAIFACFVAFPIFAGNPSDSPRKRPAVGLVLSGGGAKGFAYIGLLRVIDEVGLPVDYIGGSSIGSIVGGLYAIGYHPDSIAKMIRSQEWTALLQDEMPRKYVAYEEKGLEEKTVVSLPLKNKKLGINSMYQGQEIELLLNRYFSPVYQVTDFRKLPIPFLCIGTNLFTGDGVVLDHGYLPMAIRASMSIPGYFAPVDYEGYYLVDGGVVNNYPVQNVKAMGAQIIVGGDVQSGLLTTKEELSSLPAILDQITSYARTGANRIADSLTDLHVRFKMTYGMMDFEKYDSIIAFGERVAREHYAELKALADSLNAISPTVRMSRNATPLKYVQVDSLVIRGNHQMPESYFTSMFAGYRKQQMPLAEIEKNIRLTYGSGYFERVTYSFEFKGGKTILVVTADEGGPGKVAAGVHYDSDYGISLIIGGTFRNVLGRNSKIFADLNIAVNPRIRATYLLGIGGKNMVGASVEAYNFKVSTYTGADKTNKLDLTNYKGSLFYSHNFKNMVNLKAGFEYEYFRFRQEIVIDSSFLPFSNFSGYGNLFATLNADTRDRPTFPTRGVKAAVKCEYVLPLANNWTREVFSNALIASLKFEQSIPLTRRIVLQPGLFAGATVNSAAMPPVQHLFGLGGLTPTNYIDSYVPFTGLHFIQEFGYYALVGRMKLQANVYKKIYVKGLADFGGSEASIESLFAGRNFRCGYGATMGYDSFIGPLELSFMGSNMNKGLMVFLNLGYWF